jgi:hypothetical protein
VAEKVGDSEETVKRLKEQEAEIKKLKELVTSLEKKVAASSEAKKGEAEEEDNSTEITFAPKKGMCGW